MVLGEKGGINYAVENPNRCEYRDCMKSHYSIVPVSSEKKDMCGGIRNRYFKDRISLICRQCPFCDKETK